MEHSIEPFETFMSQLKDTNATLDFFCDFDKISANVDAIAMHLNSLNYLIGQEDMPSAIRRLWSENPRVFDVLDILIAVRTKDKKKAINREGKVQFIEQFFKSPEQVTEYIVDTGLAKVLADKKIKNLVDYVFGVETGLDSNARKNRSGHIMEHTIANIFQMHGVSFEQEVYSSTMPGLEVLGEDEKRFDFVVRTKKNTYCMEVNFYSGGGSKLNEVARAYSDLSPKVNSVPGYQFVWITDGRGWLSAKNKLEEAYTIVPNIYNLTTIEELISIIKSEL